MTEKSESPSMRLVVHAGGGQDDSLNTANGWQGEDWPVDVAKSTGGK